MRNLNLAICDDEADILSIVSGAITSTLKKYDFSANTEIFKSALELEKRMQKQEFELIFLDIEMPVMDGITFAKKLRETNTHTDIIFISNREERVFDALRINPAGFIRKRKFLEDVTEVLDQWMQNKKRISRNALIAETNEGTISVTVDTILYIEGDGRYQQVHSSEQDKPICIHSSMQNLEKQLWDVGFIRIHKGYLVNYKYIKRLKDNEVILTNAEAIPISRLRVQEIRNKYLELMKDDRNIIL